MIPPFIPDGYHSRAYIAGGWAACPALAADMDVWILKNDFGGNADDSTADLDTQLEKFRAQVLQDLRLFMSAHRLKARVIEEDSDETGDYCGIDIKIRKVCNIDWCGLVKVHLMVTDAPIIEAILDNFDITTHQIAIDQNGQVIKGPEWTPVNALPRVIEHRRYEHTDARLKKITERYARLPWNADDRP